MGSPTGFALLPLMAIIASLVAVLVFALVRFAGAARDARRRMRETGGETALLSAALQEAVIKLKAQERAMAARADASERLSGEIISSLTAGLLVVGLNDEIPHSQPGRPAEFSSCQMPRRSRRISDRRASSRCSS